MSAEDLAAAERPVADLALLHRVRQVQTAANAHQSGQWCGLYRDGPNVYDRAVRRGDEAARARAIADHQRYERALVSFCVDGDARRAWADTAP